MSDRWSNTKVTDDNIRLSNSQKFLIGVLLDQQLDYWYDPCGKSGHHINISLTRKSRNVVRRLKALLWHGEKAKGEVLDALAAATTDIPSPDQQAIRGAAAIAANALYFDDDSDYKSALFRIVRTLSPEALKRLDDGTYDPEQMPDEPIEAE